MAPLRRCLQGLKAQSMSQEKYEILVVDNGTSRFHEFETENMAINLRYLSLTGIPPNPYTCRNQGIAASRSEYVVFLDANTIPHPRWLETGLNAMMEKKLDIGAGEFVISSSRNRLSNQLYGIMYLQNGKNHRYQYGFPAGNLFVKRSLFETMGLFDDSQVSGGDIAWTREAVKRGYPTAFIPGAIVKHGGKSISQLLQAVIKYGKGAAIHAKKDRNLRIGSVLKNLLPMRWDRFNEAVAYRHPSGINPFSYCLLYVGAYGVKLAYAAGLVKGLFYTQLSK